MTILDPSVMARAVRSGDCLVWTGACISTGYGAINRHGRVILLHRAALEQKLGRPLAKGEHALHRCDNPACLAEDHVFLGSHADNMADMKAKGRASKLGKHPGQKLSVEQVIEIKGRLAAGDETRSAIARDYDVDRTLITRIAQGERRAAA